ncbi:hypothetical protein E2C01_061457 [Portunus trituberculatus]|uniref:Uncharacterized protein n=1 Tax=Portunus trituberculatus TaxID=210409 RepID=A0A5B7HF30_PORTR|nr:hypothetical protein [Portunus trituberculatus]
MACGCVASSRALHNGSPSTSYPPACSVEASPPSTTVISRLRRLTHAPTQAKNPTTAKPVNTTIAVQSPRS